MKAWLLYNPYAGRFDPLPLVERAARTLRWLGWEVSLRQSHGLEDVARIAAECAAEGSEALFVAGGDGTVGQAARGLGGTKTALGVLPSGTANVFAQELGLAGLGYTGWFALEQAARRLAHGQAARMDMGRCNGETFLLWAGVGLDGFVINRIEPRSRYAKSLAVPHYVARALWAARDWRGLEFRVRVDGEEFAGRFAQVIVSNIRKYGGGLFRLAEEARADDGLLDVWLIPGDDFVETLQQVLILLRGRHGQHPQVRSLQGRTFTIETAAPASWQLDGEGHSPERRFEIEVWPKSLKVLLPAQLPQPALFRSEGG